MMSSAVLPEQSDGFEDRLSTGSDKDIQIEDTNECDKFDNDY